MIACRTYVKNEDTPENKGIVFYGFKLIKTNIIDNYILIGCESDGLYKNDELFNFWSKKFIIKEIEKRGLKITGLFFVTLVKRNNIFTVHSIDCD